MTKIELQAKRLQLINQLNELPPNQTKEIQYEIARLNAEIKALNVQASLQQKQDAEVRRKLGKFQFEADSARAKQPPKFRDDGVPPTLGEMILIRAKQVAKLIDSVPAASCEEFTNIFAKQLESFIENQKELLKEQSARLIPAARKITLDRPIDAEVEGRAFEGPAAWNETWAK